MKDKQLSLSDWPLWRLLVELHDSERYNGADSPTTRVLARLVSERLASVDRSAKEAIRG
jgi:hypothetical protein